MKMEVDGSSGKMATGAGTRAGVDVENCEVLFNSGLTLKDLASNLVLIGIGSIRPQSLKNTSLSCEKAIHQRERVFLLTAVKENTAFNTRYVI